MTEKNIELIDGEVVRRGPYPEFTWTAILVGWGIGAVIAASISYAALKLGFSIEGSELAAILGWGILRGLMGRTSILENNINQTVASAVNGASSGIMFSVPALYILNRKDGLDGVADFSIPLMIFACIAGAFIGLAFVIPLRKQMIDFQRLPYPGGIAVATILKSPGAGIRKAYLLFGAAIVSGLFSFFVKEQYHELALGSLLGIPPRYNLVFYLSLMTIGVGFLSGKGGFWFGAGGFICYWLLSPIISSFGSPDMQMLVEMPGELREYVYKPSGIGMLIGAALGGIIVAFPLIKSALGSMKRASASDQASQDEMPISMLISAIVLGSICLVFLAYQSVAEMTLVTAIIMATLGTLWIWIAGVIVAECIGRTNWSPLSGMTLIAVTILIVIAIGMGMDKKSTIISCMVVGAAICLAISQASDMMLDLKSGYLVGGVPKRQQFAQFIGAWLGPCLIVFLMILLNQTKGIGSDDLPAPQASALASVIEGIVDGNVPTYRYTAAGILGFLLAVSGLGGIGVMIALGFYMPFDIVLTYSIGCLLRVVCNRYAGDRWAEEFGIPIAAGLIVGEALLDVGFAMVKIIPSDWLTLGLG